MIHLWKNQVDAFYKQNMWKPTTWILHNWNIGWNGLKDRNGNKIFFTYLVIFLILAF